MTGTFITGQRGKKSESSGMTTHQLCWSTQLVSSCDVSAWLWSSSWPSVSGCLDTAAATAAVAVATVSDGRTVLPLTTGVPL